jgi:23S rRNA (adenine2030-N6)-methyltransferase
MNYRHGFHAGNHADVLKHLALLAVVNHICLKPKPFFAFDGHAGAGRYDLTGPDALRSGEFRHGIGRLVAAEDLPPALAPYVEAVRAFNPPGALDVYPGSPLLLATALRAGDRLVACELAPGQAALLGDVLRPYRGARVEVRDGYAAAKAVVPPAERRGLVLFDPPFERGDEFALLARALTAAWKRWPAGTYLAWYPVADRKAADGFLAVMAAAGLRDVSCHELFVRAPQASGGMAGSGLLAVNASYVLGGIMASALPYLARRLAQGSGAAWRSEQVVSE